MLGARRLATLLAALALTASASPVAAQPATLPPSSPQQIGPPPTAVGPEPAPADAPAPPPAPAATAATPPPPVAPAPKKSLLPKGWEPSYTVGGYVEASYTYAFEKPSNGIINDRGFDNRHNTFTLQNAVIDAQGKLGGLSARVALQVGRTPDTYYLAEPRFNGSESVGPSSAATWRFVQQAYAGYKFDVASGLAVEAGIFLSPVGLETMGAKDDWNYSRSNVFIALPFYHTGVRLTLDVTPRTSVMLMLCNGANTITDNNSGKSVISQIQYKIPDRMIASLLYMGGPERPSGAVEGQPWRHIVNGYASGQLASWLELAAEFDTGFERNRFGLSYFGGGAAYARFHPVSWLYLAARGDRIAERRGRAPSGALASPITFPARWVTSGTFTFDARPHDHVSLRLEYRHDQASEEMYFKGEVKGDGEKTPYVPNAKAQNTITVGAIAWF